MRTTPLDTLLHDVTTGAKANPASAEFLRLLTDHPLGVNYWPEWRDGLEAELPGDVSALELGPKDKHFCLFSDTGLGGKLRHRPVATDALDGIVDTVAADAQWTLDCVLVYRMDADNFDVIGIMRDLANSRLLPEVQIRFTRCNGAWTWKLSPTGFVNPYIYGRALARIPDDKHTALDDAVNHYGAELALYLGGYHKWLQCNGRWEITEGKPARTKLDKHGRVKKFYKIASGGYKRFVPEGT